MEILDLDADGIPLQNRMIRDDLSGAVSGQDVHLRGQPIEEGEKGFNAFSLSSECPPMQLSKPYTLVSGNATTVESDKTSRMEEDSMVHGVSFFTTESFPDEPVIKVLSGKRVVFIGCTFADQTLKRFKGLNTKEAVTVEENGQAIFIGCLFVGVTVGVKNEGGPADAGNVILIGCSKRFTGIFGTDVTEVSSLG